MNTSADPEGLVRQGNERVLRARFNDARFFWDADQHKKLADRVDDLAHVTFQAKLGSYLEKTERIVALVRELGRRRRTPGARRCSAKCDLTTEHGQGIHRAAGRGGRPLRPRAGRAGARLAGHLRALQARKHGGCDPRHAGGRTGLAGRQAGHAARLLPGRASIPTGSKDPFALRRAAQGVVKNPGRGQARASPCGKLAGGDRTSRSSCWTASATTSASSRLPLRRSERRAGFRLGRPGGRGKPLDGHPGRAAHREFRAAGRQLQAHPEHPCSRRGSPAAAPSTRRCSKRGRRRTCMTSFSGCGRRRPWRNTSRRSRPSPRMRPAGGSVLRQGAGERPG